MAEPFKMELPPSRRRPRADEQPVQACTLCAVKVGGLHRGTCPHNGHMTKGGVCLPVTPAQCGTFTEPA